jgi:glutaredoxin
MAPVGAAQLYRWVDEQGRVEWRDTPPPASAKNVERRTVEPNTIQTSTLPYNVQQAVKDFPVTLWVFDCGEPCNAARNHLARRGIPHTERNADKEREALRKMTGSQEAPVLTIGARHLKGYLVTDWDTALDAAGYPRTPVPGVKTQSEPAKAAPMDAPKGPPPASSR